MAAWGAALSVVGGLFSAAGQIYGGKQQRDSLKHQAGLVLDQGRIMFKEALRDAAITRHEGEVFAANQSLQFLGAGFEIGGSALIATGQTLKYAEEEATAITVRGRRQLDLATDEGRRLRKEGRAAMVQGILGGIGSILGSSGSAVASKR